MARMTLTDSVCVLTADLSFARLEVDVGTCLADVSWGGKAAVRDEPLV